MSCNWFFLVSDEWSLFHKSISNFVFVLVKKDFFFYCFVMLPDTYYYDFPLITFQADYCMNFLIIFSNIRYMFYCLFQTFVYCENVLYFSTFKHHFFCLVNGCYFMLFFQSNLCCFTQIQLLNEFNCFFFL